VVGSGRGGERLLLVEDESAVREIGARVLRDAGYSLQVARDAEEAMRIAQQGGPEAFDLLVTDVVLPGGSGRELAHALRRDRPGLRVLFVSGFARGELAAGGGLPPDSAFLEKPFGAEGLRSAVRRALALPQKAVTGGEPGA
jgi:DNA-binding NtrC family response regulator